MAEGFRGTDRTNRDQDTFTPIDLNAAGWTIYSRSIGRSGGITLSGTQLQVWGYSATDFDSYSSGGAQTVTFEKAKGRTISYNFFEQSSGFNTGKAYIYITNLTKGTTTTIDITSYGNHQGTYDISDNDTYVVRMYVSGAGGQGGTGNKTITIKSNSCTVS